MARRLLLVRHGQSTWNAQGRWQGSADPPLSDVGRSQALQLADALRPEGIDAVVTSDLVRARETAAIVTAELGLAEATVEARLRERDVGDVSGLTVPEIDQRWPGLLDQWRSGVLQKMPGGEDDITPRVTAGLLAVARAPHPGTCILVVTHGGVIGAIDRWLGGTYQRVGNIAGRWLEVGDDGRLSAAGVFVPDDAPEASATVVL